MKAITLVCLALMLTSCLAMTTVQASVTCTCSQIQYEYDCHIAKVQMSGLSIGCSWTPNVSTNATDTINKGTCASPPTTTSSYCNSIPITQCSSTLGCATSDGIICMSIQITGCSAYIRTTDALCQAVSTQCTTDGIQCMPKAACMTYSIDQCGNSSTSGSGTCKVSSGSCIDQVCSDVTSLFVCFAYSGCIWNGAYCATTLLACANTQGTATTCPLITGLDGPCKFISGTNCSLKTCADAPATSITDAQCVAFLKSCLFTTGKGCVTQLQTCSTYLQSDGCTGYYGSDGPCIANVLSTTACRAQVCTDATINLQTDSQCNSFKFGCVSTGQGCVSVRGTCSSYFGTVTTCFNYIGSDGKCKGNSTTKEAACAVRVCTDNSTSITNAECAQFQVGCLTTGIGCVSVRGPCSGYKGSTTTCAQYIGSDGYCKGTQTSSTCVARECTDNTTATTNTDCSIFKASCVTTGLGCVTTRGPCSGYIGTISTCANRIGSEGQCKGTYPTISAACAVRACTDNNVATTTTECRQYLPGCISIGRGCVSILGPCNSYKLPAMAPCDGLFGSDGYCTAPTGSGTTCVLKTGSTGTNIPSIPFNESCESQITVSECQMSSTCLSTSICNDNTTCASYTTQSMCIMNKAGFIYLRPCIWNQSSNTCTNRTCASLTGSTAMNDSDCNSGLLGCVYSGSSTGACVEPDAGCGSFYGTNTSSSLCATAMGGRCWGSKSTIGPCVSRVCSLYSGTTPTTDQLCAAFLSYCVSDGNNACMNATTCSGYNGTAANCKAIISNTETGPYVKYPCIPTTPTQTSGACKVMTCTDIIIGNTPWAAVTSTQCSSVIANCTTSFKSGSGKQCIEFPISCDVYKASFNDCKTALTSVTGQTCSKYANLCTYIPLQACTSYQLIATDVLTNQVYCQGVSDPSGNVCGFISGGTSCTAQSNISACTGFSVISSTAINNFTYCQSMKANGTAMCGYTSGSSTCIAVACSQIIPTQQTDCYNIKGTTCIYTTLNGIATCLASATSSCRYTIPNTLSTTASKLIWCNSIRDSLTSNGCGYSSGLTCSPKACTDLNMISYTGTLSQGVCNIYIAAPACTYSGFSCEVKENTLGVCSSHTIPTSLNLNDQQKQQFCNALPEVSAKQCTWDGAASTCTSGIGQLCTNYTVTAGVSNILSNQAYCSSLKDKNGITCYHDGTGVAVTCATGAVVKVNGPPITGGCLTYVTVVSNDLANQIYCAKLSETDGSNKPCAYVTGGTSCISTVGTACTDVSYKPVSVATEAQKLSVCLAYDCGYQFSGNTGTSTGNCIAATKTCEHLSGGVTSLIQCENYLPGGTCGFNAVIGSCYTLSTQCGLFTQTTLAKCAGYINNATPTQTCGILSAGDSKCKVRACSDITNATQSSDCSGYLSTCIYDGTSTCQIKGACTSYKYAASVTTSVAATFCQALVNVNGLACTNDLTANSSSCVDRNTALGCISATTASNPLDCYSWGAQCAIDTTSSCANQYCTDSTSINNTSRLNVTNGCTLVSILCSTFSGNDATCRKFSGNNFQCYQPNFAATATTPCQTITDCTSNTTATLQNQCEAYWPSKCKNGIVGCVSITAKRCIDYSGTIDSICKTADALDGPCTGVIGMNSYPCQPIICSDAPNTATTDEECNQYKRGCVTNGKGCQTRPLAGNAGCQTYQSQASCIASKLGGSLGSYNTCAWTSTCLTRLSTCISAKTAAICAVTTFGRDSDNPLGTCSWYINGLGVGTCRITTCADLPATNTTDKACSSLITICTTNGAGCITKGSCSSYSQANRLTCISAATTDYITKCSWDTKQGCIMQQCADNKFTNDIACNVNGLKNCKSNGITCVVATNLACTEFLTAAVCIKDSKNQPCLWINGVCQSYIGCTSIAWTTHAQCQLILTGATRPQCTSDGIKCQPLNSCINYKTNPTSCVIGNDGSICGMLPTSSDQNASYSCRKLGACTDDLGKNNVACRVYGINCISNGTSCQLPSKCSTYTQTACSNLGTDGACFWSPTENACRTQRCSDATTNTMTDAGCAAFPAPYINTCTSDGTNCIIRLSCAQYTLQSSCVLGNDGACFWTVEATQANSGSTQISSEAASPQVNGRCRVKVCSDLTSTTTPGCINQILNTPAITTSTGTIEGKFLLCVSNGTNCIPKANCATYTNRASCQGLNSGLDGTCAFIPTNETSINIGVGKLITQCTDAGTDSIACGLFADRCQYKAITSGTTITYSCVAQDCVSRQLGSICRPIPSWDLSQYTLCLPLSATNLTCAIGDGGSFTASACFTGSAMTHTWNQTEGKCIYCQGQLLVNNTNGSNQTTSGTLNKMAFLAFGAFLAVA